MANVPTLVTVYSEVTECNGSYIGMKLNQKDTQKLHWIQNPITSEDTRLGDTFDGHILPHH